MSFIASSSPTRWRALLSALALTTTGLLATGATAVTAGGASASTGATHEVAFAKKKKPKPKPKPTTTTTPTPHYNETPPNGSARIYRRR